MWYILPVNVSYSNTLSCDPLALDADAYNWPLELIVPLAVIFPNILTGKSSVDVPISIRAVSEGDSSTCWINCLPNLPL